MPSNDDPPQGLANDDPPQGLANKIAALRIGESLSFSTRWPTWQKPATPNIITESRRRLKNGVAPHVMRAKTRSGGTFTVDTTVSLSHDYSHIIVAVIITRLTARARSK
jgi:hypothetical protein